MRARFAIVLFALALAGCEGFPRPETPEEEAQARAEQVAQCYAALDAAKVDFRKLPDRTEANGCARVDTVSLGNIGRPVRGLGPMTCPVAERLVAWLREDVDGAAKELLGTRVTGVDTFGTYSCRPISGSDRLSQHAFANAVDIAGFRLANGRSVSVRRDWNGADADRRAFLRAVHKGGCARFRIVLGPDYNQDHADHFHFDMTGGPPLPDRVFHPAILGIGLGEWRVPRGGGWTMCR